ncbi:MAG: GAF and ANTAR domain-containing protein [Actinocatenispora sp.]
MRVPPADRTSATVLQDVARVFAELATEVANAKDMTSALDAVAQVAARRISGASWVSVTIYRPPKFVTAVATDERARRADALQYDLRSGPCVDAIIEDVLYHPGDVRNDERWPEYGPRAAKLGVASMVSYRLALEGEQAVGGLNVYSEQVNAFDEEAIGVGLLLAAHGSLAVSAAARVRKVENLQRGMESNRDIGVAVGVLMARHALTREKAFDLLCVVSQDTNRKVHALAIEVADTGMLALPRNYRAVQLGTDRTRE